MSWRLRSFFRYQFPAILWAIVIFALSSIPGKKIPHFPFPHGDKVAHLSIFFLFCAFTYRAVRHQSLLTDVARYALPISLFLAMMYGVADEFHQVFVPGRTPDIYDLAADTAGALLYVIVMWIWKKTR